MQSVVRTHGAGTARGLGSGVQLETEQVSLITLKFWDSHHCVHGSWPGQSSVSGPWDEMTATEPEVSWTGQGFLAEGVMSPWGAGGQGPGDIFQH